jgi:hypothetical protein
MIPCRGQEAPKQRTGDNFAKTVKAGQAIMAASAFAVLLRCTPPLAKGDPH